MSSLWYQLTNHYSNIQLTLWCLSLLNLCQVFWHWSLHCTGRLCGKYFFMRSWRHKKTYLLFDNFPVGHIVFRVTISAEWIILMIKDECGNRGSGPHPWYLVKLIHCYVPVYTHVCSISLQHHFTEKQYLQVQLLCTHSHNIFVANILPQKTGISTICEMTWVISGFISPPGIVIPL